jgi:putative endonuclease
VKESVYHLYIVKCCDDTLYTGITTDVVRRVKEHNTSTRGAHYTSLRRPVELLFYKVCSSRSEAIKEELRVKRLPRVKKLALVEPKEIVKRISKSTKNSMKKKVKTLRKKK